MIKKVHQDNIGRSSTASMMFMIVFVISLLVCQLRFPVASEKATGNTVTLYNIDTQFCCRGNVFDKSDWTACCGNTTYDKRKALCCVDTIIGHPREDVNFVCGLDNEVKIYHFRSRDMCLMQIAKIDSENDACCVSVAYNTGNKTCCSGRVHETASGWHLACCGNSLYDYETQLCCRQQGRAVIYDKRRNLECCGADVYDTSTQKCCTVYVHNHWHSAWLTKIHNYTKRGHQPFYCCGLEMYDLYTQRCNDENQVVDLSVYHTRNRKAGACGQNDFITDVTKQMCCDGVKHAFDVINSAMSCCGTEAYNEMTDVCCGNKMFPKDGWKACCHHLGTLYDESNEVCCPSGIVALTEDDKKHGRSSCCEANDKPVSLTLGDSGRK